MKLSNSWIVKTNVFILLVAPSGKGKSPSNQVFMSTLLKIEEEERKSFDAQQKESMKRRKEAKLGNRDSGVVEDTEDVEEDETCDKFDMEKRLFNKKTRIIETSTPEALILNLYYGSKVLLVKADEWMVFLISIFDNNNLNMTGVSYKVCGKSRQHLCHMFCIFWRSD